MNGYNNVMRMFCLLFPLFIPPLIAYASNESTRNPLKAIEISIYYTGESLYLYHVEKGHFPEPTLKPPYSLEKLTTPIAYRFESVPLDYFQEKQNLNPDAYKRRRGFYVNILLTTVVCIVAQFAWLVFLVLKRKQISALISFLIFEFLLVMLCLLVNYKIDLINISRLMYFLNDKKYPSVQFYNLRMISPPDKNRTFYYSLSKDGDAFVWSPGPDCKEEFTLKEIPNLETEYLLNNMITYSPSNGLHSVGDLWTCVLSDPVGYPFTDGLSTFHEPLN
ncbi:MAG: hypothetical protein JXR73_13605 [Candidatus Omnitrophica bacterium]|nr:hypothetical protein [Candidatus Omnitrophota bacterium]